MGPRAARRRRGGAGVDRLLDEAGARAEAFAERHAGKVAELDGPGLREAMTRAGGDPGAARPRRQLRRAALRRRHRRPRARRAAAARAGARPRRSRRSCCSSSSSGPRSTTSAPRSCSPAEGLDFCRHHLRTQRRYRPHLLTEPEERVMTEKGVTGRSAWARLFSELTSAIEVESSDGEAERVARRRAEPPDVARPRGAPRRRRRRVTEALQPGLRTRAFIFNTLLHDKAVDDRLRDYPSWICRAATCPTRPPTSRCRRSSTRCAPATSCRSAGTGSRRGCSGIDRLADYDRSAAVTQEDEHDRLARGRATWCSTPTPRSRPSSGASWRRFFDEPGSTRRCRPTSAAARSAPTRVPGGAPLRAAQLDRRAAATC